MRVELEGRSVTLLEAQKVVEVTIDPYEVLHRSPPEQ
jgi:hypothetical protein